MKTAQHIELEAKLLKEHYTIVDAISGPMPTFRETFMEALKLVAIMFICVVVPLALYAWFA